MPDQPAQPERRPLHRGPVDPVVPEWWSDRPAEPDPQVRLLVPTPTEQRIVDVIAATNGRRGADGTFTPEPLTPAELDGAVALLRVDAGAVELGEFGNQVRRRILAGSPIPPPKA